MRVQFLCVTLSAALVCGAVTALAQQPAVIASQTPAAPRGTVAAPPPALPPGYVIGADDVLAIKFWRDADISTEAVMVRPDGKISLPLLNEIQAAGFTPEQLRLKLMEAAVKYVEDPNVTVVVKEIKSRTVFITGQVARGGPYPLMTDLNVLQLIALAGGLLEYADAKNISVIRMENGR